MKFFDDKSKNINGYGLNGSTGELQVNANITTTAFIKVPNDGKYYINTPSAFQPMILQYDKNKNYIPYQNNGYNPWLWSSSYNGIYYSQHQKNTCYIRVGLNLSDVDRLNISLNNDKTFPTPVGKSTTQSILLPQPLNKIGEIKDKFYWDEDKGHYCIEENVPKIYLHTLDWTHSANTIIPEDEISFMVGGYYKGFQLYYIFDLFTSDKKNGSWSNEISLIYTFPQENKKNRCPVVYW
jgi:hypothetical protein